MLDQHRFEFVHKPNRIKTKQNSSSKIGYRLALVKLQDGATKNPKVTEHSEFVTGWLGGKKGAHRSGQPSWGRPADVQQLPDGSLLISDDGAHTIYRLHYKGA